MTLTRRVRSLLGLTAVGLAVLAAPGALQVSAQQPGVQRHVPVTARKPLPSRSAAGLSNCEHQVSSRSHIRVHIATGASAVHHLRKCPSDRSRQGVRGERARASFEQPGTTKQTFPFGIFCKRVGVVC